MHVLSHVRFTAVPSLVKLVDVLVICRHCSPMASKSKVFISRPDIPQPALKFLKEHCEVDIWNSPQAITRSELLEKVKGKDALFLFLSNEIDAELLDAAGKTLKVVSTMSVGTDHVNKEDCVKRSIPVGYTPDVLTDATAELGVTLMLATARRIVEATKEVTNGGWKKVGWGPLYMGGLQIKGSTIGIVGLGRIGQGIAKRMKGFEVRKILYCGSTRKKEGDEIGAEFVSFDELLNSSDIVVACCPLTSQTKHMFNEAAFAKMKRSAIFINISRGGIVHQDSLYAALISGTIKAAGLDVTTPEPLPEDHPLTRLNNCIILPHIGSATTEARTAMAMLTAHNILAALEGKDMPAQYC